MPNFNGETYTVRTAEELAWIASASRTDDFAGKTVRLAADLDLGGSSATPPSWEPIGSAARPFQGELDGANHVIYNLYILSVPPLRRRADSRKRKRGGRSPYRHRARTNHDGWRK